jgi:heptosyltransferase-3
MANARGNQTLRSLDRYVGIPAAAMLALRPKRRQPQPKDLRRIALMKTAAVGDTLLLTGLVEDIGRSFPKSDLVFVTGPDNYDAALLIPGAIRERLVVSPHQPFSAVRALRQARLDMIIDFGSWPRFDALLASLSGASFCVGFRTSGQARHYGFDLVVDHQRQVHERENYRRLLAAIGVEATTAPRITAPQVLAKERLPPTPYVVFHPWPGGFMREVKEWPQQRWVKLGRAITLRGWQVVVVGGKSDQRRSEELVWHLRKEGAAAINSAGTYSLRELADVLSNSAVAVCVNSGIVHLAALLGARVIDLHGPTPVERWGPIGPHAYTVVTTLPGCGYLHLGFEYKGHRLDCMSGIEVEAVEAAIDAVCGEDHDNRTSHSRL